MFDAPRMWWVAGRCHGLVSPSSHWEQQWHDPYRDDAHGCHSFVHFCAFIRACGALQQAFGWMLDRLRWLRLACQCQLPCRQDGSPWSCRNALTCTPGPCACQSTPVCRIGPQCPHHRQACSAQRGSFTKTCSQVLTAVRLRIAADYYASPWSVPLSHINCQMHLNIR